MGGVVIHDDVDIKPFRDLSIDLFEEVQELGCPVALVAFTDDKPRGDDAELASPNTLVPACSAPTARSAGLSNPISQ
jgi:hypothetical protein